MPSRPPRRSTRRFVARQPTNHPRVPPDLRSCGSRRRATNGARAAANVSQRREAEVARRFREGAANRSQPGAAAGTLGPTTPPTTRASRNCGSAGPPTRAGRFSRCRGTVGYLSEAARSGKPMRRSAGRLRGGSRVYERLVKRKTSSPDDILMRLGRAAQPAGDMTRPSKRLPASYYEFPLSELAAPAAGPSWHAAESSSAAAGSHRFKLELGRAERLFGAKRYTAGRGSRSSAPHAPQGDDRELVKLRLAECDYFLKRARNARDGVKPFTRTGLAPGRSAVLPCRRLARSRRRGANTSAPSGASSHEFPTETGPKKRSTISRRTTSCENDDEEADAAFRELFEKFPRALRRARGVEDRLAGVSGTASTPTRSATSSAPPPSHDRITARPWLYWSGRAHRARRRTAARGRAIRAGHHRLPELLLRPARREAPRRAGRQRRLPSMVRARRAAGPIEATRAASGAAAECRTRARAARRWTCSTMR